MKFRNTDNGNCRVYYTESKKLFCYQERGRGEEFDLYVCSKDGEPSHQVELDGRTLVGLPQDDSATARHFREWINR